MAGDSNAEGVIDADICAISRIENHAVDGPLKFRSGRHARHPYGSNPDTCPVRAWRAWLEVSGITEGPTFRSVNHHGHIVPTRLSAHAVALVLKRHAAQAGLDPDEVAGHALRTGLATSAAAVGVPGRVIAEQTVPTFTRIRPKLTSCAVSWWTRGEPASR
jgi:hypothetical protein